MAGSCRSSAVGTSPAAERLDLAASFVATCPWPYFEDLPFVLGESATTMASAAS